MWNSPTIKETLYDEHYHTCSKCEQQRVWYKFPLPVDKSKPLVCFNCKSKRTQLDERLKVELEKIYIQKRLQKLINFSMANKMTDLREHLFDALTQVKENKMEIPKAKSICEIAQTIINSVKVEVEAIKALGGAKKSEFMELEAVSN